MRSENHLFQFIPIAVVSVIAFGVAYYTWATKTIMDKQDIVKDDNKDNNKECDQTEHKNSISTSTETQKKQKIQHQFNIPSFENDSQINSTINILIIIPFSDEEENEENLTSKINNLSKEFCGETVFINSLKKQEEIPKFENKSIYLCGNLSSHDFSSIFKFSMNNKFFIIQNISKNYQNISQQFHMNDDGKHEEISMIQIGQVPILVHNVGVLYRQLFNQNEKDYFNSIQSEHSFQSLTESTKPGTALRTGIYLTPVEKVIKRTNKIQENNIQENNENNNEGKFEKEMSTKEEEEFHFRLLRCSTNLSGPTGNFQKTDHNIINLLNEKSNNIFINQAPLNHVLAQIYRNKPSVGTQKESKAKIKEHSDKTKDMPLNGVMAFVTFYDQLEKLEPIPDVPFDYGIEVNNMYTQNNQNKYKQNLMKKTKHHKNYISGLTTLFFRLKKIVAMQPGCNLVKSFSVTLSPGSVFFMPLSTNRIYTHEIRPSAANAHCLPIRMGYVVRCSNTEAVFKQGQTFIKQPVSLSSSSLSSSLSQDDAGEEEMAIPLQPPTNENMKALRDKYAEENYSAHRIEYDMVNFSMNNGDYEKPCFDLHEEFRSFHLNLDQCLSMNGDAQNGQCGGGSGGGSIQSSINIFDELMLSAPFETAGKGREGAVLVKIHPFKGVPIVRTTTKYHNAAQEFNLLHLKLASEIEKLASLNIAFNNCLIENYTNTYMTMGYHSDQALDLDDTDETSSIALFSCYQYPDLVNELSSPPRKLVIEPKDQDDKSSHHNVFEIPLRHNSVVIFSLKCNKKYKHKIVLETNNYQPDNVWVGLTFRTSKTFIKFKQNDVNNDQTSAIGATPAPIIPCFEDGTPLKCFSNSNERKEFYHLRSLENKEIDFTYPSGIYSTISPSDLLPPMKPNY